MLTCSAANDSFASVDSGTSQRVGAKQTPKLFAVMRLSGQAWMRERQAASMRSASRFTSGISMRAKSRGEEPVCSATILSQKVLGRRGVGISRKKSLINVATSATSTTTPESSTSSIASWKLFPVSMRALIASTVAVLPGMRKMPLVARLLSLLSSHPIMSMKGFGMPLDPSSSLPYTRSANRAASCAGRARRTATHSLAFANDDAARYTVSISLSLRFLAWRVKIGLRRSSFSKVRAVRVTSHSITSSSPLFSCLMLPGVCLFV
mmetsp:Transcript_31859/g.73599  ORF Transcript_31859/g.73599 Transcript_31859/m.73599 type:complete len:265 (-) Transcript_31859:500-1294(-)